MRKQKKHYSKPKKPFDKERIEEEKKLIKSYGLKNKGEIWKAESSISRISSQAKKLITQPEQQAAFLARLKKLGLIQANATLDDVLALTKEKLLERRLQTVVFKKGLAKTPKEARQLITHKKILVDDKAISSPGHIVKKDEEKNILIAKKEKKEKKAEIEKIEKPEEPKEIKEIKESKEEKEKGEEK